MNNELKQILQDILILIAHVSEGCPDDLIQNEAMRIFTKISKMEVKDE